MLRLSEGTKIYVSAECVDFRKAINGLSALVVEQFASPVTDGSVYVFYNRGGEPEPKCDYQSRGRSREQGE